MPAQNTRNDTSWWDRLTDRMSGGTVPPPPSPRPPGVDETAWAKNVERDRISPQLNVHDLGLIVFNESQSFSDRPDSNEPITSARQKLAHSVINADQEWGAARQDNAGTALPIEPSAVTLRNPAVRTAYESAMEAAREAYLSGADPTSGAVFLNQRINASRTNRVMSAARPRGVPLATQSGPYNNSFPNRQVPSRIVWLNTYKDE